MFNKIVLKLGDNQFYNALKVTFTAIVSFFIFYNPNDFSTAFTVTLGALLCAPIDIASNFKHKAIGLLLAAVLIPLISLTLTYTYPVSFVFIPLFCLLVFFSALISLYGHRANLLSFTLLLTISLSFIHHDKPEILVSNCLYLLIGGMFYSFVSILFYFIKPNRYINLEVADCIEITSKYLKLRAQLWEEDADREKINHQMLEKQIKINELHERIREYLVYNKARTINSNNNRKLLIALTSLVEILELSMANAFNHKEFIAFFKKDPSVLKEYKLLAQNFALALQHLAFNIKASKKHHSKGSLTADFKRLRVKIDLFLEQENISAYHEKSMMINNLLFYADKQVVKIKGLERVYKERVNADELRGKYKDLERFFTPEHYRLKTLIDHLNFKSSTFRYALRVTLTMLAGLFIGTFFEFENAYWILLTIVVIMRPGYGLTKQRSTHRVIGTIIGGILGIITLVLIDNNIVLSIFAVFSMLLGYWLSGVDYKIGVSFVTFYVILIYGLLTNEAEAHLVYRILDTAIGSMLAFLGTRFLWPSWELHSVNTNLEKSLRAIQLYIVEVKYYYINKGEPTTEYKLARKNAFIESGNLMASFQRLIQEPKTKQLNRVELYELTVLCQTLVSSAASIGTYIQFHNTSQPSETFKLVMDYINNNITQALNHLDYKSEVEIGFEKDFNITLAQLKMIRKQEIEAMDLDAAQKLQKLEESQLIIDQLIWMSNLSEKIEKLTLKMK